jgi:hypothetical protein
MPRKWKWMWSHSSNTAISKVWVAPGSVLHRVPTTTVRPRTAASIATWCFVSLFLVGVLLQSGQSCYTQPESAAYHWESGTLGPADLQTCATLHHHQRERCSRHYGPNEADGAQVHGGESSAEAAGHQVCTKSRRIRTGSHGGRS